MRKEIVRKAKILAFVLLFLAIVTVMFVFAATDPFGFGKGETIGMAYVMLIAIIWTGSYFEMRQSLNHYRKN